jgi:hypothetical protein
MMALIETLVDEFDGAELDGALWSADAADTAEVYLADGQLVMDPGTNSYNPYAGSIDSYTLEGSQCRVHVTSVLTPSAGNEVRIALVASGYGRLIWSIRNDLIRAIRQNDIDPDVVHAELAYDAEAFAWLSFRWTGSNIVWEYSADGIGWTEAVVESAAGFAIDSASQWGLAFSIWDSVGAPGQGLFTIGSVNGATGGGPPPEPVVYNFTGQLGTAQSWPSNVVLAYTAPIGVDAPWWPSEATDRQLLELILLRIGPARTDVWPDYFTLTEGQLSILGFEVPPHG